MKPLTRNFYARDTVVVAKALLGKLLVRRLGKKMLIGKIVEVEAYKGFEDPASHAYRGETSRNKVMFGRAGHAYIYFTYGNHYLLNVKTERIGVPGAVLIRALEPLVGVETMLKLRGVNDVRNLTNGPGKLTKALNITAKLNGLDLTRENKLFICKPKNNEKFEVECGRRVGIKVGLDKLWRFYVKNNPYISKSKT